MVTNLTKKIVTVPKHSRLANLTKRPAVILNTLENFDINPLNTYVESVSARPIYKENVTKEYLTRQHEDIVRQDSWAMKTDWKDSLNFNDKYDQYRPESEELMTQYAGKWERMSFA